MITSPSTGVNSTAWDFVAHYSPINAWVPKNIVVVNTRVFDRLDADTQTAFLAAADTAQAHGWKMLKAEATSMTVALVENGITVYDPSAELTAGLQAIGATMLENWNAKASDSARTVLKAYED